MASYTIFEKPDPMKSHYTIKDIIRYTLIIDKNKNNIFINYETDATIPCSHIRCNPNNFINETFTLEEFFNLKQGKKYKHIVVVKKLVIAKLLELIK